jgi:hypothetical protein
MQWKAHGLFGGTLGAKIRVDLMHYVGIFGAQWGTVVKDGSPGLEFRIWDHPLNAVNGKLSQELG